VKYSGAIGHVSIGGCAFCGFSQTTSGLSGTVTDLSGASMPGAKITLTGTATERQTTNYVE
jgi:hypothetical protein